MTTDECLVGSDRATVIAHLVVEHRWGEWDATDLHAVNNLHAELHEQLDLSHDIGDLDTLRAD